MANCGRMDWVSPYLTHLSGFYAGLKGMHVLDHSRIRAHGTLLGIGVGCHVHCVFNPDHVIDHRDAEECLMVGTCYLTCTLHAVAVQCH